MRLTLEAACGTLPESEEGDGCGEGSPIIDASHSPLFNLPILAMSGLAASTAAAVRMRRDIGAFVFAERLGRHDGCGMPQCYPWESSAQKLEGIVMWWRWAGPHLSPTPMTVKEALAARWLPMCCCAAAVQVVVSVAFLVFCCRRI